MATLSFARDLIELTTILGSAACCGVDNICKHPVQLGLHLLYMYICLLQHIQSLKLFG